MTGKILENNVYYMSINPSDIDKITNLARMKLNAKEKDKLLVNLNKLLEHLEIINKIDTEIEVKSARQRRVSVSPKPNIVNSDLRSASYPKPLNENLKADRCTKFIRQSGID